MTTITLTKPVTIAGVSFEKGDKVEATPALALLLLDCGGEQKPRAKKKAARAD